MGVELYEHNKEAYDKVLEHFKTSNKTCVIHPTGTGKSFISLKFLYDNRDKKCLFMAPTDAIVNQIKTHIEESGLTLNDFPNLEFCLYASSRKIKDNKYDYIVFDEFHRIGADIWGSNVKELLDNNKDTKVLGVTATPVRYLDDGRDMSIEIFDGDIASHLTLAEAIVKRILPAPNYIGSIISFQNKIDKIQKQIDNYINRTEANKYQKLLDKAIKMLENSEGLPEIFDKNIQNKNGKFIVFCRNYDHMIEMEENCKDWFKKVNPNIEISDVYCDRGSRINQKSIKKFEDNNSDSLKLLFSIDMLNEGLHVKDIDGVIMFRPTESPIIYLQQLGRALSVGHNEHPLVFDIVNNYSSLDYIRNLKNEVEKLINDILIENPDYEDADELYEILDTFKIMEQNQNIIRILERLENETFFSWDSWYELAKAYYEHHNNLDVPIHFRTLNGYEYDESGINLGIWIRNQRNVKNGHSDYKLTEEKIKKLEDICMIWEPFEYQWNIMYNLAKIYYEHHGNLLIPNHFKTINGYEYDEQGVNLGTWIRYQRYIKKSKIDYKLTEEKIKKLEDIRMIWEPLEYQWNIMYNLAKEYYKYHGNLLIHREFKTLNGYEYDEQGVNLGKWIMLQKLAFNGVGNKKLKSERIKLLNEIGMQWDKSFDIKWLNMYNLSKIYYDHYGNLLVPTNFKTINGYEYDEQGLSLGIWIGNQRRKNNKNKLTDDKVNLLNEIKMVWEPYEYNWNMTYFLAKIYYEHYGNLLVPKNFKTINGYEFNEQGLNLESWINRQKTAFYNGELSIEKEELLKLIGVNFEDKRHLVWLDKYEEAKTYYEKHGNLDVPFSYVTPTGFKLGYWISKQKELFNNGKLSENRIELLKKIGITFEDKREDIFFKRYEEAKKYYEEHGDLNVPQKYITKTGFKLGYWLSNIKRAYVGKGTSKITSDYIKVFENIKMIWFINDIDNKLQKEEITEKNKLIKQKEILNRFYSLLCKYDEDTLPSKDEINKEFVYQLNRKKK